MNLSNKNKTELVQKCKELNIKGYSSKNKKEIIEMIENYLNKDIKNNTENNLNIIDDKKPTFIEVCAGGGGLSSGLIKAGFMPLLLNDNDKNCCETLKLNHKDANVICCSMDDLDISKYIGKTDLLTGGVPCQAFSQAGLRKGLDDPRGELMIKFIDMIKIIKPKIFMIENVKGLITHESGKTINDIINLLNENNEYNVVYRLLNSFDYNVPQKRERVFIIGTLKNENIFFNFPEKNNTFKILNDVLHNVPESPCSKYSNDKIELFK